MEDTPATLTDEQVALLIQEGDREKFGILMERYSTKLARYGRKFLARRENIEDIVQDVFVSAFQNIQGFDASLKFSSWIYRIAHNAFVNELKKTQRRALPHFDLDIFVSHHSYEEADRREKEYLELKKLVEARIEELPPKYKEAVILHYLEDFSYKEISDILRVPIGTVGIRIKRGKDMLKESIGTQEYATTP